MISHFCANFTKCKTSWWITILLSHWSSSLGYHRRQWPSGWCVTLGLWYESQYCQIWRGSLGKAHRMTFSLHPEEEWVQAVLGSKIIDKTNITKYRKFFFFVCLIYREKDYVLSCKTQVMLFSFIIKWVGLLYMPVTFCPHWRSINWKLSIFVFFLLIYFPWQRQLDASVLHSCGKHVFWESGIFLQLIQACDRCHAIYFHVQGTYVFT